MANKEFITKLAARTAIENYACRDCEHSNGKKCDDCEYQDCINFINEVEAADVQPVNQWISCKDKMPEHGVTVLIYAGNHMIMLAWYDKDMEYFYICDSDYKYNPLDVTHWQPLPEPPKEG